MAEEFPPGSIDLVLHMVTREEWRAVPPEGRHLPVHPFKLVVDHFTYTDPCLSYEECVKAVQDMQRQQMAEGLKDIKWNFLVGGDGNVYEGRGWHVAPSKTLKTFKRLYRRRIDIAYIGDYTDTGIPELMQTRFLEIVDFGKKFNMIKRFHNSISVRKDDDLMLEESPLAIEEGSKPGTNAVVEDKQTDTVDEDKQSDTVIKDNVKNANHMKEVKDKVKKIWKKRVTKKEKHSNTEEEVFYRDGNLTEVEVESGDELNIGTHR